MKTKIIKILKEEIDKVSEKHDRKILSTLKKQGFDKKTEYSKIIDFLVKTFGFEGIDTFKYYILFRDNYGTIDGEGYLLRRDINNVVVTTSNSRARVLVSNKIPFKGSNTSASYVRDTYVVYSYGWYPIFVYKNGQWYENENRYSMSTAKQMSQLRPYDQGEIIKVGKNELSNMI